MNKILRKLAGVFGASPIPQAGLNAQLMMDKYLLGAHIRNQHCISVRHFHDLTRMRTTGFGFHKAHSNKPTMLRGIPFCHVVKVGFKKSVIRVHGLELLVENKYIKQQEA